jgi:hypothetical protein
VIDGRARRGAIRLVPIFVHVSTVEGYGRRRRIGNVHTRTRCEAVVARPEREDAHAHEAPRVRVDETRRATVRVNQCPCLGPARAGWPREPYRNAGYAERIASLRGPRSDLADAVLADAEAIHLARIEQGRAPADLLGRGPILAQTSENATVQPSRAEPPNIP